MEENMQIRSRLLAELVCVIVVVILVLGCDASNDGPAGGGDDGVGDAGAGGDCGDNGATECQSGDFATCTDGQWVVTEECTGDKAECDPELGCVFCVADQRLCEDDNVVQCNSEGTGTSFVEACADGKQCLSGDCTASGGSCEAAAMSNSYLGCEFIAVSTSNAVLSAVFDNDFAVVIGNPESSEAAEIEVSRNGQVVNTLSVPGGDTVAISLPMVLEIKNATQTGIVKGGAYEISSSVPVVAYQYNPLNFTMGGGGGTISDFSYTNDASLLLPVHSLTGNYMASTWPTWGHGSWMQIGGGSWSAWYPGFVTVAASVDGTEVVIESSTYTQKGNPGPLEPGESATVVLNRGDVLQLYSQAPNPGQTKRTYCEDQGWQHKEVGTCPPKNMIQECDVFCSVTDGDLTGTKVTANQPVAVFAGHMCTFIPYYSWACDHLEEMMLPVETWGESVVMTAPLLSDGSGVARTKYRVLAKDDGTDIIITPGVIPPFTLNSTKFMEFETDIDFIIEGQGQFYVTQTLLSQDENSSAGGDPAMGSGIPLFQSRGTYAFLTPDSYTSNYVNVVAPNGTTVNLDGVAITGWQKITSTSYSVARVPIEPGPHVAKSDNDVGFGITSYGYASYTSYLYPGGLNLKEYPVR
jgi:IgGFc binding protein